MPRYLKAMIGSLVVTFGLLFLMSTLIATGKKALVDEQDYNIIDFVRVKQEQQLNVKDRKIDKPEKPATPPPPAPKPQLDNLLKATSGIDTGFSLQPLIDISLDNVAASDGDYLPIVKVQPTYPRRALARGIEGYVIVEFIVSKLGTVVDPRVIESVPPGVFDREALRAALKFKYKPKVINGEPVDVAGVRNKITFQLDKESARGAN